MTICICILCVQVTLVEPKDVHSSVIVVVFSDSHWGTERQGRYVLKKNAKIRESKHKLNILTCKTTGFDGSDRLVTTVLIPNVHSRKNQNIFLRIITATA